MLFVDILSRNTHLVSKNWPNDPRVGSFPTNLVELIEVDVELEEELEEFEGFF
jgi:hypothetical protein